MSATIDDAIELLTDPANKTGMSSGDARQQGFVNINGGAVLAGLIARGAADEPEARVLARDALAQIGGQDKSRRIQSQGLGLGRRRDAQRLDVYWVPIDAMPVS